MRLLDRAPWVPSFRSRSGDRGRSFHLPEPARPLPYLAAIELPRAEHRLRVAEHPADPVGLREIIRDAFRLLVRDDSRHAQAADLAARAARRHAHWRPVRGHRCAAVDGDQRIAGLRVLRRVWQRPRPVTPERHSAGFVLHELPGGEGSPAQRAAPLRSRQATRGSVALMGAEEGEGGIYQRADGRWVAAVELGYRGGRRHRKIVYGRTRREAREKLVQLQAAIESGIEVDKDRQTVEQFLGRGLRTSFVRTCGRRQFGRMRRSPASTSSLGSADSGCRSSPPRMCRRC